jgi:hypothetical protein
MIDVTERVRYGTAAAFNCALKRDFGTARSVCVRDLGSARLSVAAGKQRGLT